MTFKNIYFCFLLSLISVNLIFADNINETQHQERAGAFPFPFNPFSFFSQFLPFGSGSSRQTRDVSSQESNSTRNETNSPNNRFFFSLGSSLVTCNYTANPGLSCVGCNQALSCRSSNVGVLRRCLLYCNSGRCSLVPGAQCTNSNSTSG